MTALFDVSGQGWPQLLQLALAFLLSALVGLEREVKQKSAGIRTYTLVGVSAALFMLISKYGFMDVLSNGRVVVDPSRVAAQVVSGIGFIGGGVIFMRRDVVRGLTTAASVWLTAALGMACGAGLPVLAVATTLGYFTIMLIFPRFARALSKARRTTTRIRVSYVDGRGLLRTIMIACTSLRFAINHVAIERDERLAGRGDEAQDPLDRKGGALDPLPGNDIVVLTMQIKGKRPVSHLIARLSDIEGVVGVGATDQETELE